MTDDEYSAEKTHDDDRADAAQPAEPRGAPLLRAEEMSPEKLAEIAVFRRAGQKTAELARLVEILQKRSLRTVVEIGTDRGGTFWLWCQLAQPDARLVSIDMPGGSFGVGYTTDQTEIFRTWTRAEQRPYFLMRDAHLDETRDELIRVLDGMTIDLLFLDGDHSYEGTYRDFTLYSPLVSPDGLIVFHDIVPTLPHQDCHSYRVWRDIKSRYAHDELIEKADDDLGWRLDTGLWGPWGGIGVIHWPGAGDTEPVTPGDAATSPG